MSNPFAAAQPNSFATAPAPEPETPPAPAPSNPFTTAPAPGQFGGPVQAPPPAPQTFAAPTFQAPPPPPVAPKFQAPPPPPAAGNGHGLGSPRPSDPFADPTGPGSGEKVADMVGHLLIIKPLELIEQMSTENGDTDAYRVDIAILDHPTEPGHIADGVLVFQRAVLRDIKEAVRKGHMYVIGRLGRGQKRNNKSAPYILSQATPEERAYGTQFLEYYRSTHGGADF